MKHDKIAFIGGGNMARSLIGGLIAGGCPPARLRVADPQTEQLDYLRNKFGVHVTTDNADAVAGAEIVVLAVKPQIMHNAATAISAAVATQATLVISIAAGIDVSALQRWLGADTAIVRCMPNTPALVRAGATALYANPKVTEAQREKAESILRAVGIVQWVEEESLMDAVTALSGSGPAYFFLLMEVLENAGKGLGLPADAARLLTLQTAYGAAKMALESADSTTTLRERVTSPGGTTQAALEVLEASDLRNQFKQALKAARDRGRSLSRDFGKN